VLLSFLMPITLITLFALAFGGNGGPSDSNPIRLPVVDLDSTATSIEFVHALDSVASLNIVYRGYDSAKNRVVAGQDVAALIIHPGYGSGEAENALELMYDPARQVEIGMLQSVLFGEVMSAMGGTQIKSKIKTMIDTKYGAAMDSATYHQVMSSIDGDGDDLGFGDGMSSIMDPESAIEMTSVVTKAEEKNNPGLVQAVAGTAVMMLLFSLAGLGGTMLEEKEAGTLKKLIFAPLNPYHILFGKMAAGMVMATMQLVVMFVFAWLVFGLNIFVAPLELIIMVLATAFACTGLGMLLASVAKTRQQVQGVSTIVILIMSAVGGSMIPLFVMPPFMQDVAVVSINYWSIDGFFDIFWRTNPVMSAILPNVAVLIGAGILFCVIAAGLFKRNILKMI